MLITAMMPLAPTPVLQVPAKPKIGFSIESIVGGSDDSERGATTPPSPLRDTAPSPDIEKRESPLSCPSSPPVRTSSFLPISSSGGASYLDTLASLRHGGDSANSPYLSGLGGLMTNGPGGGLVIPQPVPCSPLPPSLPPVFLRPHHPLTPPHIARDTYPLYPWLLSRHGRIFGHGFPGADAGGFLLQPFRKPKRIRTAFSPSQLLKLEQAFEKNHYVVGAERKQLAQTLSLSETQVKVWFQNRRTKHKRIQQEEDQKSPPPSGSQKSGCSTSKEGSSHLSDDDMPLDVTSPASQS